MQCNPATTAADTLYACSHRKTQKLSRSIFKPFSVVPLQTQHKQRHCSSSGFTISSSTCAILPSYHNIWMCLPHKWTMKTKRADVHYLYIKKYQKFIDWLGRFCYTLFLHVIMEHHRAISAQRHATGFFIREKSNSPTLGNCINCWHWHGKPFVMCTYITFLFKYIDT